MRSWSPPDRANRRVGRGRSWPLGWAALLLGLSFSVFYQAPHSWAQTAVPESATQVRLSFAPVVKRSAPSVVSITTKKSMPKGRDPFFDDPFFRYFFRDFAEQSEDRNREQHSLGSGAIVSADGLIVTNNHVVADADEITVVLHDRRELDAELVMSDERSDLAFLRVDTRGIELTPLPFGDSDMIEVGDLVLAIGNPFGIGQTVTSGIISANARATPDGKSEVSFIQTDAAINPGNSGGALISIDGELIGINTAIFTRSGGSIGIGFAIPVNLVRARIMALEQGGEFFRPWLGASTQPVDPDLALTLGIDRPYGVLIKRVHPESAAAGAGLRVGDVVLQVDGIEVIDEPGLRLRLALKPLGQTVALDVWREGALRQLTLGLAAAPREPEPDVTELRGRHPLTGLKIANMSPGFNEEMGLDMFQQGIVVLSVDPRSFSSRLRLRRGDLIEGINSSALDTVDDLEALLERGGDKWKIDVRRGQRVFTLTVS